MKKIHFFYLSSLMTIATQIFAADVRYPINSIENIKIIEPSNSSSWENKNWLDCNDVILDEEDVKYALKHMRRISKKVFFDEDTDRTGCSGAASVKFKGGKTIVISVEPTGYIHIFETNRRLQPKSAPGSFYDCEPCKERKMDLLKDALDRATEQRIQEMKRQGRLPP